MPLRRPLTDLVLITTFKMLTPNEQMVASEMSPRCAVLMRAANRTVKTLIITDEDFEYPSDLDNIKNQINCYSLASKPAMQPLMDIPDKLPFPDFPMTTRLNKWNILKLSKLRQLLDTATIEQITTIFSAVTDLKFIILNSSEYCEFPVSLLQHPNWQCQLTNLMMRGLYGRDSQLVHELITAINGLTALQRLALELVHWFCITDLPDLTILAQLKVVAFKSDNLQAFVRSLEQYATENAHLQVHLFSEDNEGLLSLNQPLHSRIVYFGQDERFLPLSTTRLLCSQFRFLTSLTIYVDFFSEVEQLFTALSQLYQLVHLNIMVRLESDGGELATSLPPRPLAQMNSLQVLELDLTVSSHSAIKWFNLPVTMPNLQTIYIQEFCCGSCEVEFHGMNEDEDLFLYLSEALSCFQSSLFTIHFGVPLNRQTLKQSDRERKKESGVTSNGPNLFYLLSLFVATVLASEEDWRTKDRQQTSHRSLLHSSLLSSRCLPTCKRMCVSLAHRPSPERHRLHTT